MQLEAIPPLFPFFEEKFHFFKGKRRSPPPFCITLACPCHNKIQFVLREVIREQKVAGVKKWTVFLGGQ